MNGAPALAHVPEAPDGSRQDVQGLDVPAQGAALAKAITGAYLSSGGNAFSTSDGQPDRAAALPAGALDRGARERAALRRAVQPAALFRPRRALRSGRRRRADRAQALAAGLAADPGGFPLYKNGVLVGGVGVLADGTYGFDANILDVDSDVDERIALAGTVGFEAQAIRANRITVDGTALRYSDADYAALGNVATATYAATAPGAGRAGAGHRLLPWSPAILAGAAYGSEASGIRRATAGEFANSDAFVLSDGAGGNRYPIRAGTDAADVGTALTTAEVRAMLEQAFAVMSRARGQIRQPLDSRARGSRSPWSIRAASYWGWCARPTAPIFGIDVSLQKARTASFFSAPQAGADLLADSERRRARLRRGGTDVPGRSRGTHRNACRQRPCRRQSPPPLFPRRRAVAAERPVLAADRQVQSVLDRAATALVFANLGQHLNFVTGASGSDTAQRCTVLPDAVAGQNRLQNGLQIFPGSVPIYRNGRLVGGIGVSGDGIDQDDMISFLGLDKAGRQLGTIGNAPAAIRSDRIEVDLGNARVRLRYVGCPFAPFLDSAEQNVCEGL